MGYEHQHEQFVSEGYAVFEGVLAGPVLELLNVVQRQGVTHIHLHEQPDDLRRAVEVAEGVLHQPRVA